MEGDRGWEPERIRAGGVLGDLLLVTVNQNGLKISLRGDISLH